MTAEHAAATIQGIEAARRPPRHRLESIEALRGIAATAVVLYHASRHVGRATYAPGLVSVFSAGHAGVDLFFVISGFIIFFVHGGDVGRPERLSTYLNRRFTRVMPLYWVALAITLVMAALGRHGAPSLASIGMNALLLPGWGEPIVGVAWTLRLEIVFYAVFAVLIVRRAAGCLLLALWVANIVVEPALGGGGPPQICDIFGLQFFMGMAAALAVRRGAVPVPRLVAALGGLLFLGVAATETAGVIHNGSVTVIAYGLAATFLVTGVASAEQAGLVAVARPLTVLGGASYAVYLFHFIFIGVVWQVLVRTGIDRLFPTELTFVALAGAGLLGGLLTSLFLEKPLLRRLRKESRKLAPLPPVAQHDPALS